MNTANNNEDCGEDDEDEGDNSCNEYNFSCDFQQQKINSSNKSFNLQFCAMIRCDSFTFASVQHQP